MAAVRPAISLLEILRAKVNLHRLGGWFICIRQRGDYPDDGDFFFDLGVMCVHGIFHMRFSPEQPGSDCGLCAIHE